MKRTYSYKLFPGLSVNAWHTLTHTQIDGGGGGGRQIDRKLYFKNTHTIKEAFH